MKSGANLERATARIFGDRAQPLPRTDTAPLTEPLLSEVTADAVDWCCGCVL